MSTALSLLSPDQWRVYSSYADAVKVQIEKRLNIIAPCMSLTKGKCDAMHAVARNHGLSFPTVYRWYQAAKAGDLHALADKSRDPKLWVTKDSNILLPAADIALWKSYVLRYQRDGGMRAAYRQLIRDWRAGKVTTTQPLDPMRGHPAGWSLANLGRHRPSDYELAAMRGGKVRASNHRPQVLTTRVGLRVGQFLVGDDVWHDHVVHWRGQRTPVRPVEASVLDLYSGALVQWGLRPRLKRADGTRENLTEREVRWVIAAAHRGLGYRADELGTTWLVEKGTFAIREPLAKALQDHFNIRVETSGIASDKAWFGAYGTKGGGNARFKTWLESIHNLRHNEMAAQPGQVGKDRDHSPEELKGLTKYAERMSDTEERLALVAPQLAARIKRPVQTYAEFLDLCERVYEQMNTRIDHALEGWRECGHETVQYLLGKTLLNEDDFLALPPPDGMQIAQWGVSLAERGLTRTRLLSPAEVLARGRGELAKLPAHGVSLILGPDLGREQAVEAGEFVWEDAEMATGELRYFAEITTPEGRRELLRNGEKYLVHANPFLLAELCVSDAKGRFLGVARRHDRANRADREAMGAQFKAVAAYEAQLMDQLAKVAEPIMRERMGARQENVGALEEALNTRERNAEAATAQREQKALARRVQAAAARLTEDDKNDFLSNDEKPAAPAATGATGSANEADQGESLADYL